MVGTGEEEKVVVGMVEAGTVVEEKEAVVREGAAREGAAREGAAREGVTREAEVKEEVAMELIHNSNLANRLRL